MYVYSSRVEWTDGRRGRLSCGNGFRTVFAPPPEFQGESGPLTPEDAFVASVNMSFTLTFLKVAQQEKLDLRSFECSCNGIMERVSSQMTFKRIVLHPRAVVGSDGDIPKAERCMELAEKLSPVRNSVKPKVVVEYKMELDKKKGPAPRTDQ